MVEDSSYNVNSFNESDIEGTTCEFNLIDSNNDNEVKYRINDNVYMNISSIKKLLSFKFYILS